MASFAKTKGGLGFDDWITPERLILVSGWCKEGCTNKMLAEKMGITLTTLYRWQIKSPELKEAIREGKDVTDYKVENALLRAALGYEHTEVKTILSGEDAKGNRKMKVEKTTRYYPPNVNAAIMWLCNRKPDTWKRNRDAMIELTDEEAHVTVNVTRHSDGKGNEKASLEVESRKSEIEAKRKAEEEKMLELINSSGIEADDESWGDEVYEGWGESNGI